MKNLALSSSDCDRGDCTIKAFVVQPADNVATALEVIEPGKVMILGGDATNDVSALESITVGHKIALRAIEPNAPIVKYGVTIGCATQRIEAGQWVHLHNCASNFDERSNTLDVQSGAPTEADVYR